MVRHTWLTLLLMALFAFSQGASDGATERPRVLMDRSHEWTFVQDDLNRMFMDLGAHVYMCDAALDTRVRLDGVDVACIMQWDTQVDFTDEETALLTTFVRNGGALLLIGQDATPVSKVAFAFGLPFRRGEAAGPLQVEQSLQELGAPKSIPITGEITNVLLPPPSADVLVSGSNGAPLCAALRYGAGRVVCLSVCNFRWDWRTDAPAKDAVAACTKAILASLLPEQRPAGRGEAHVVRGECELHLGNLHVYYPASIANASGALIEQMPRAIAAIQHLNRTGLVLTYPRQEVNLNASWAGGWSGGYALGVQALGRLEANLGVLGHELTHSYHGPLPYLLAEAYASYVSDYKLLRTLGLYKDPRPFDDVIFEQYQALDPDGIWQDFATYDPQTQRNANEHALNMRLRWLCAVLERRYGDDFMCRFIEIIRALHPETKPTMQECLYYLNLASGEDLTPWLRSVGVTVMPVAPVEPGYLNARLADYRRDYLTLDEAPEGLRYSDLSPQLSGDDWRADWRVSDNLCPAEAQWIADASDPPAAWSRDLLALQLPPDELPRLGLLAVHAPAPERPCRVIRELDVPKTGRTSLLIGATRRSGYRSWLRLLVDGKECWQRGLMIDGWFNGYVDLTPYAGKRVSLELQSSTHGEWGCREVFIDYLTPITFAG